MGWRDRFTNLRDVRGVRLAVDAAPDFSWADGTLPVTITFEGRGDADQVVTQVEVKLERRDTEDDATMFLYTLPVREVLPAGQIVVRTYAVPLVLDDRPIDPDHLGQVPGWMAGLIRRVAMGTAGFTGRTGRLAR
jgi:hypothetical protein